MSSPLEQESHHTKSVVCGSSGSFTTESTGCCSASVRVCHVEQHHDAYWRGPVGGSTTSSASVWTIAPSWPLETAGVNMKLLEPAARYGTRSQIV